MGNEPRALARRGAIHARSTPRRAAAQRASRPPCFGNDFVNDTA